MYLIQLSEDTARKTWPKKKSYRKLYRHPNRLERLHGIKADGALAALVVATIFGGACICGANGDLNVFNRDARWAGDWERLEDAVVDLDGRLMDALDFVRTCENRRYSCGKVYRTSNAGLRRKKLDPRSELG